MGGILQIDHADPLPKTKKGIWIDVRFGTCELDPKCCRTANGYSVLKNQ